MRSLLRTYLFLAALLIAMLAVPAGAHAGCPGAATSAGALGADQAQSAVRCVINDARHERGARKLNQKDSLEAAAQYHATDMAGLGYFSHNSPSGEDAFDRAESFGYLNGSKGTVGEVIGAGTNWSPREVVRAWLDSGPHRSVLLSRRYRHIGVGVSAGSSLVLYSVSVGKH
jgi:uncharacterized protein YkwD